MQVSSSLPQNTKVYSLFSKTAHTQCMCGFFILTIKKICKISSQWRPSGLERKLAK